MPRRRIEGSRGSGLRRRRPRRSLDRSPAPHALFDRITEGLVLFLVVFTPWAFGTTETWSIWVANLACYGLGGLLLGKWWIRRQTPFQPARWGEVIVVGEDSMDLPQPRRRPDWSTLVLAVLTVGILAYILISAINARADYDETTQALDYLKNPLSWLPASYDRGATWFIFWQYLGLACAFWAVRDWILHRSPEDLRERDAPSWAEFQAQVVIPVRLRRLLWVLCLNAALLAVVSIIQRAEGTNKLLWIVTSASDKPAELVFGPWPYRGNAAQYFNLVWPVCVAFWLWSQERAGRTANRRLGRFDGPQLVLLPCAIFAGVAPMISSSRGGAIISAVGGMIAALMIVLISRNEVSATVRWLTTGGIVVGGLAALVGGWTIIRERLSRPDTRMPTGMEVRNGDFSLLLRMRLPTRPDGKWTSLASLGSNARISWHPNSLHVAYGGSGMLAVHLLGSTTTNLNRVVSTNFLDLAGGREVVLGVVRQNDMQVYLDGEPLGIIEGEIGDPPGWDAWVHARYLTIGSPIISEVALVNFALTPEELTTASGLPLETLGDALLKATPFSETDPAASTPTLPDGAVAGIETRTTDEEVQWLVVRRDGSPGQLGFGRYLSDLDPRLRGPLRASLTAWNPSDEPIYLGIGLDGGARGFAEVPPRSETTVTVPCRAPHNDAPQMIEVLLLDENGEILEDAPADSEILVRNLQLQPGASVFGRHLAHELRFVELGDRMSGRNEIYENAVEMAKDFFVWGSGAGSFTALYQLYLKPGQDWAAYAHNDWLETRITFGAVGLVMLVATLLALLAHSLFGRGLPAMRIVIALWWLALAGCLIHARFDFPFQIYSVLFLFILLCGVLMGMTARRSS